MAARRSRDSDRPVKPAANAGLTLYVAANSIESDWVRLVLAEKEVDAARVTLVTPGRLDEDLAILNPSQSLPTLADREGVLVGAWIIAEYLDERYPHPKLTPPAPAQRARLRMALRQIESSFFPLAVADGSPAEVRAATQALQKGLAEMLDTAARHFGARGWFLGFDYNLADCAWAVLLRRLPRTALTARPALEQYAQRLFARPAFRKCFGDK